MGFFIGGVEMFIDWNKIRKDVVLSAGFKLDFYGDLFALKRFDFVSCHKLYLAPDFMMEDSDDYSAPDGYVDEFEFFIYMFKDLFN